MHRFLWAVGDLSGYPSGQILAERFYVWDGQILLDTLPLFPPPPVEEVPLALAPYLRLAALPLQVPRPYTVLTGAAFGSGVLLLEDAPLAVYPVEDSRLDVALLPTLSSEWVQASPLHQLNWLRQIVSLWPALSEEKVAASLLIPEILRVDSSILRLLALAPAGENGPTLADLGRQWQTLVPTSHAAIREGLAALVDALVDGSLATASEVESRLERAIALLAPAQPVRIETLTLTDQGPSRSRNEDACYPESGRVTQGLIDTSPEATSVRIPPGLSPLTIVCDGIGGHESGNVASHLAIQVMQEQLEDLLHQASLSSAHLSPTFIANRLQAAIKAANDAICHQNDQEQRQARERMGTTLVITLVMPPYLFVGHLGDSRAYRITARSCCQVTLDDDVAARETRLGYALYRDALTFPNSGSLVQALGIGDSRYLYPTVQHFLLADDSLFLICSDGLSDYERVDLFWFSVLRPALSGSIPLRQVGEALIDLANAYNGHDNVTVGLVTLSSQAPQAFAPLLAFPGSEAMTDAINPEEPPLPPQPSPAELHSVEVPTRIQPPVPPSSGPKRPLLWVLTRLGIGAAILAGVAWVLRVQTPSFEPLKSLELWRFILVPEVAPLDPDNSAEQTISVGSFWQVNRTAPPPTETNEPETRETDPQAVEQLRFHPLPGDPAPALEELENASLIPVGSILKVISSITTPDNVRWVRLQICSVPTDTFLTDTSSTDTLSTDTLLTEAPQESDADRATVEAEGATTILSQQLAQSGEGGWLLESQLVESATLMGEVTQTQKAHCF